MEGKKNGEWENLTKHKHFVRNSWTKIHKKCDCDVWTMRCSKCGKILCSESNHPFMTGETSDLIQFLQRLGYSVAKKDGEEVDVYEDGIHPSLTARYSKGQTRRVRVEKKPVEFPYAHVFKNNTK